MSSINDIMEEERNAQQLLRDAQQRAEAILTEARARAAATVSRAESDDTLLREMSERQEQRIAKMRAGVLAECQARLAETERLCQKNLEASVNLIVADVLGADLEQ